MTTIAGSSTSTSTFLVDTSLSSSFPTASSAQFLPQTQGAYSGVTSTIIALTCALLFLVYLCVAVLTHRYAKRRPRAVNKKSGVRLQTAAPAFYSYVVVSSLIEISLASWLLIQYSSFHTSPSHSTTAAIKFHLFCAVWTYVTSGIYSILFLHPHWSEFPLASIGSQFVWILVTWLFWIIGVGLLDGALPTLLAEGHCNGIVFCGQIRGLFALAVLLILTLTAGMGILFCLAWLSAKYLHSELDD